MNRLTLAINLFVLSATLLGPLAPAEALPCKSGNPKNSAYMLRKDDLRCEGITDPEAARSDFDLSSFTVGVLQPADRLTLRVPKVANLPQPKVRIQSSNHFYQLDPLSLSSLGNQWQFQWNSNVLRQANIAPGTLRGVAQSEDIVLPILLKQAPTSAYNIAIDTGGHAKTITFQILQANGTQLYSKTLTDLPGNEASFAWNGRTQKGKLVPAGRYILKVQAQVERRNAPSEFRSTTRKFEHNPAWLN